MRPAGATAGVTSRGPTPLLSVTGLNQRMLAAGEPSTLLDVRWELGAGPGRDRYATGHIPGAAFVDLEADLAGPPGSGGRHPLPDAAAFQASMRSLGVCDRRAVVVYDAAGSTSAARAWWLLRYFGHDTVAVLDGGFAAWVAAGHAVARGEDHGGPVGDFTARPGAMPVLDADGARFLAGRGRLLDARAPERFRGETEPVDPVAGHIPGARNHPTVRNLEASGHFRSPAALREAFGRLGVRTGADLGAYCGSGVTAAHQVLALEVAGFAAALYPGSWSEWVTDPARPVATGA